MSINVEQTLGLAGAGCSHHRVRWYPSRSIWRCSSNFLRTRGSYHRLRGSAYLRGVDGAREGGPPGGAVVMPPPGADGGGRCQRAAGPRTPGEPRDFLLRAARHNCREHNGTRITIASVAERKLMG